MEKQEMYEFLKRLTFDYYYGRKTKEETVHELINKISPADNIPTTTNEEKLIFNLYWDLKDLTHDPPFHTRDIQIEYYIDVLNGKRKYSEEDLHNYAVEKGIDNVHKLP